VSLARGAELAGTGICSGEGGMLPEEQAANSRYFYEYASGAFGFGEEKLRRVQAMHFKAGQGAKTGTGGHLPGTKVVGKIAEVRGLEPGTDSISPATFPDLHSPADFKAFSDRARDVSGGIPIGFKMSANHIEGDIDFALEAGADYIILDGRGGGTGAAPRIFRDNISVPTIPALARARRHLDECGVSGDVTLIVTGGLRVPADYVKALALGADGIALSNAPIQAVGCIGARLCNTDRCPSGVATQNPELRALIDVDASTRRVARFFEAAVQLMQVMARACGRDHLGRFEPGDIATWHREMAELTGIAYAGSGMQAS
jgi:glutamate synthase domain-containing protein 2